VERLDALGLRRYEIANFARAGHESKHTLKYWRLAPYRGFGADAHGYDGQWRVRNADEVHAYVDAMERTGSARVETTPAEANERYWVGLRLMEGIALADDERARWSGVIEHLHRAGLLEESNGRLRLTARGVLLSNEVFQEFL
jgi:oxygen-independent coproporphyrinogen-3 oxidase